MLDQTAAISKAVVDGSEATVTVRPQFPEGVFPPAAGIPVGIPPTFTGRRVSTVLSHAEILEPPEHVRRKRTQKEVDDCRQAIYEHCQRRKFHPMSRNMHVLWHANEQDDGRLSTDDWVVDWNHLGRGFPRPMNHIFQQIQKITF